MRDRVLVLAGGLALAAFSAFPADANVLIRIDKSNQQMSVSVDGVPRWQWRVSTGRPGRDTPSGTFHAFRMEAEHFSKEFDDAPMPHSIFFTKVGHAVHGYLDTRNLGMPVSHGCVRLDPANATKLYQLVEAQGVLNTTVVVSGDASVAIARRRGGGEYEARAETAPSYGYGYRDERGYGSQNYGYREDRSQGYRQYGYREQQPSYASRDERYAPLQQRSYSYEQQDYAPTPPPNYPPFPRAWR
jgi:hypothetical protein